MSKYFAGPYDPTAHTFSGDIDKLFAKREVEVVFGGPQNGMFFTEGPTWIPKENALLFSELPSDRTYKWTKEEGVKLFIERAGGYDGTNSPRYEERQVPGTNGMALHGDTLYMCQHSTGRLSKINLKDVPKEVT